MAVLSKDIAVRVGVSDTTISMALRNHARISPARRAQIKHVAQEMGYAPNPLARELRGQQTMSVAVLWSLGGAPAHTQFIRAPACRIQGHGYVPYVADHMSDPQLLTPLLDQLTLRRIAPSACLRGLAIARPDMTDGPKPFHLMPRPGHTSLRTA